MSDGSEMFGQLMLESLLARRATTGVQRSRQGSLWIGILLIVSAIVPLVLGAIVAKGPGDRNFVAVKLDPANRPRDWASDTHASAEPVRFAVPLTAQRKRVGANQ